MSFLATKIIARVVIITALFLPYSEYLFWPIFALAAWGSYSKAFSVPIRLYVFINVIGALFLFFGAEYYFWPTMIASGVYILFDLFATYMTHRKIYRSKNLQD